MNLLNSISQSLPKFVVLFAIDRELKPFVRSFPDRRRISADQWLCHNDRILVDLLGVGKAEARQKVEALLESGCRPERIVIAGFAGALRDGLNVGDVLAVSEIVDEHGGRWTTAWPAKRSGRLFTSERMIGDSVQKRKLGVQYGADAVDMESSVVAEVCAKHGIPFGCLRVVSDDITQPLSQRLMTLVESGRVSPWRVLRELLRSPRLIRELLRLAKQTRTAAERLARRLRAELDA